MRFASILGERLFAALTLGRCMGVSICENGLNVASARGNEQVSITVLFGLGLLLGLALGPVLSSYAEADPAAIWQARCSAGTTTDEGDSCL